MFCSIKKEEQIVNKWSGGTTTTLLLLPHDASYALQNFDCRISTATIETTESNFTPMPKYQRKLMVLQGELQLMHTNHYQKTVQAFDQDAFDGSWQTSSLGKGIDFNIIHHPSLQTSVEYVTVLAGKSLKLESNSVKKLVAVYIWQGEVHCSSMDFIEKDFFYCSNENILIAIKKDAQLIISSLIFP